MLRAKKKTIKLTHSAVLIWIYIQQINLFHVYIWNKFKIYCQLKQIYFKCIKLDD